jgi:hypothetical protein
LGDLAVIFNNNRSSIWTLKELAHSRGHKGLTPARRNQQLEENDSMQIFTCAILAAPSDCHVVDRGGKPRREDQLAVPNFQR